MASLFQPLMRGLFDPILGPPLGDGGISFTDYGLFGPLEDGFLFNFSKTDRLFQDTAGTTPAVADTAPIALALEGHAWAGKTLPQLIAGQPELSANPGGPFTATTGWTNVGGSHSVSGGNLNITRGAGTTYDTQQQTHASGAMLLNQFNVIALPGTGSLRVGSAAGNNEDANQGFSGTGLKAFFVKTAGANRYVSLLPSSTAGDVLSISNFSCKAIPGNHGLQTTTSARPFWKTPNFARFDGTDDNLLTTFNPTAALTIMIRAKLTSGSSIKMIMGCCDAGTTNRLQLETNASDQLEVRVGSDGARAMAGSVLNVVGVYGIRLNGVNVDTIRDGAIVQTNAQVGAPTTTTPIRIGAFNNAGTASNFFPGDIYNAIAISRALTVAEIANLTNYWNAQ